MRILDNAGADYRFVLSIDNGKLKFVSKRPPTRLAGVVSLPRFPRSEREIER